MRSPHRLTPLLAPRSIAFVGASPRPNTPGHDMLLTVRRGGFAGTAYAVNPKYEEVAGFACYPSLAALPRSVDLAVLAVANDRLEAVLSEAITAGVRAAVIFASGQVDNDRPPRLAARLAALARDAGVPVCGANCMGFYNDEAGVWICGFPSQRERDPGGVSFIAQSGSVFGALAHNDPRLRFNLVVSTGQELATSSADYLDFALELESTRVVGMFVEAIRDPEGFVAALEKAERRRVPVVVLKVGRTAESRAMAISHTGAITGDDAAYEALFDRYGVLRVETLDELSATLMLFAAGRRAAPGGLAAVHDSGGEREMLVDLAQPLGVRLAAIGATTKERLAGRLEPGLEAYNPLDAWGTGRDFVSIFTECLSALMDDPDVALGILFADIRDHYYVSEGFAQACLDVAGRTIKPVALATNFSAVRHDSLAFRLSRAGIPVLDGTVPALKAARHAMAYRDFLARPAITPPAVPGAVRRAWRIRLDHGAALDERDALALLADYGIATPSTRVVESVDEAVAAARTISGAVALKTAEAHVRHKTEVAGVRLGLIGDEEVRAAYLDLCRRLGPRVLVQRMTAPGVELALGMVCDPQFGPLVMVGAGGTLVELLRDMRHALPPLGEETARRLIDGLAIRPLLDGARGRPAVDLAALADTVARFSVLAADVGDRIAEMDVNPLIAGPAGCVAVDALIVARAVNEGDYQHGPAPDPTTVGA